HHRRARAARAFAADALRRRRRSRARRRDPLALLARSRKRIGVRAQFLRKLGSEPNLRRRESGAEPLVCRARSLPYYGLPFTRSRFATSIHSRCERWKCFGASRASFRIASSIAAASSVLPSFLCSSAWRTRASAPG